MIVYVMKKVFIPIGFAAVLILLVFTCRGHDFTVTWNPVAKTQISVKPIIRVYVESSGSMNGYLSAGSEFKDAVYSYVSTLNSYADTLELNYINSEVVPYKGELKSFIRDLTVAQFKQVKGDKKNSDIADMFEKILSAQDIQTIAIFVSDCILDVPQGSATDYLVNRQIDIKNAFVKKLNENPDLGVEVFRLQSKYTGNYYQTHSVVQLTDEMRPYYIWIIGDKKVLAYMNAKVPFTEIKHGYENYFAFSSFEDVPFEILNRFNQVKNPCVDKSAVNGQYVIKIKANFSTSLHDESMLCDISNYRLQNHQVNIVEIEQLDEKDDYTHILTLNIDKETKSSAEYIKFVSPALPLWATRYNDDSGDNIKSNLEKTTGILNIISGVSDAYKENRELAGIKFVINN